MSRRETPAEHLQRLRDEVAHRQLDRLDRQQRIHEAKQAVTAPFRWLLDKMTGY